LLHLLVELHKLVPKDLDLDQEVVLDLEVDMGQVVEWEDMVQAVVWKDMVVKDTDLGWEDMDLDMAVEREDMEVETTMESVVRRRLSEITGMRN